jgi:hypothetical protein
LLRASDLSQSGNRFSTVRSYFDPAVGLIRFLKADLRELAFDGSLRLEASPETAHHLLGYLIDL